MTMLRDDEATPEVIPPTAPPADTPTPAPSPESQVDDAATVTRDQPRLVDEVVIEEVSIDGMCGVY
jgi:mycofactocin precursor